MKIRDPKHKIGCGFTFFAGLVAFVCGAFTMINVFQKANLDFMNDHGYNE